MRLRNYLLRRTDADRERYSPEEWFADLPCLETERLLLRRVRMKDAGDLYRVSSDREVARYCLWEAYQSIGEAREYIRYIRKQYQLGLPSSWGIESKETGQVIGTIGYMNYQPEHGCAEIGYSLAREQWNKGLMTEAVHAVLDFSFQKLRLNRV